MCVCDGGRGNKTGSTGVTVQQWRDEAERDRKRKRLREGVGRRGVRQD